MGEVLAFRSPRSSSGRSPRPREQVAPTEQPTAIQQPDDRSGPEQPIAIQEPHDRSEPEPDPFRAGSRRPDDRFPRTRTSDPLWREVTGAVLRDERRRQRRTLAQVAGRAGMSAQYLSQLERGQKEASSEMLAAACGSLDLGMAQFALRCARFIAGASARPNGPVLLAA